MNHEDLVLKGKSSHKALGPDGNPCYVNEFLIQERDLPDWILSRYENKHDENDVTWVVKPRPRIEAQ